MAEIIQFGTELNDTIMEYSLTFKVDAAGNLAIIPDMPAGYVDFPVMAEHLRVAWKVYQRQADARVTWTAIFRKLNPLRTFWP